ncbi:MAG: hypothetical protein KGL19_05870 [Bacteroidota bacterium]|nr:hypothetical protein [Bacteroidota bacterium]
MSDIDNILNDDGELSEELLMRYATGNVTEEERHKIESKMIDSSFVTDATEGLQAFGNKSKLSHYVDDLNRQLQKETNKKKERRAKRKLPGMDWIIISVIIVLLLCVLGYAVLHLHYHGMKN